MANNDDQNNIRQPRNLQVLNDKNGDFHRTIEYV